MAVKLHRRSPSSNTTKGGGDTRPRRRHIIYTRLDELGKDIKWLAENVRVTPRTLYEHISGRSQLKGRNFSRMLRFLEIDLNYYYQVGKYARSGNRQSEGTIKPTIVKR